MAYRLLLPCISGMTAARIERALRTVECMRLGRERSRWWVRDLAGEPDDAGDTRVIVALHGRYDVDREDFDSYFYTPPGVQAWIEVRVRGKRATRQSRMHARLTALLLCERLRVPALETRNGVYCRTPEAFAAWCSREPHPDTVLLDTHEHLTEAPSEFPTIAKPVSPLLPSAREGTTYVAPLPPEGWFAGLVHRLTHAKPHIIPLPAGVAPKVVAALVREVAGTFKTYNVAHDAKHNRLIIYGQDTPAAQEAVNYFRRRAHPARLHAKTRTARG